MSSSVAFLVMWLWQSQRLTNLRVVMLSIFLKMLLTMLGPLYLWYYLVFPWNSFWISYHQMSFWYSDHCIYFLIVVLSPAGRSWWFFVKSASYFATYSRLCMRSEYLALLCPRYCCCNYLFERENIDNVLSTIFASSILWSQNRSLPQILDTTELYSTIDLKFIGRSSDYSSCFWQKWLPSVYFECNSNLLGFFANILRYTWRWYLKK